MKHRLPSLHALRAFEAAARLGGFNKAARELHISPTAVSHHIRGLEAELGSQLFTRRARSIHLTETGEYLSQVCTASFSSLGAAVTEIRSATERRAVTIAVGSIIAAKWLTPRLTRFWGQFPGVDLRLLHTPIRIDPMSIEADIYLAWGDNDWSGVTSHPLLTVAATPVASPELIRRLGRPESPVDLKGYPLIHQRDHSEWSDWFGAAGFKPPNPLEGLIIEDANVLLKSALDGQGIALGWLPLIDDEIQSGRLVRLFNIHHTGSRAYHLITTLNSQSRAIIGDVAKWLLQEAENTRQTTLHD